MGEVNTRVLLSVCLALQGGVAVAQSEDGSLGEQGETIEEVVVTGTRIARRDYFSVSPITSFDRQEIALSGNVEIKTLINDLPQVDPGLGSGTGNGFLGSSRVNLRALGDGRTLTLLNGRRYANNGIFGATDLNSLPPVLIERVEVITGGASAVYGSDAIAGAVNFILRNDYEGFESSLQYDVTERGDGETYNVDIAYGTSFASGRGNLALFGNYYERMSVFQDARSFSRTPLTTDDNTGEIISNASFLDGSGVIDGNSLYTFNDDGTPRLFIDPDDRFSQASVNALLAPMDRYSASAFGHYDISDNLRGLFEISYSRSIPEQRRSDIFFGFVDVNVNRPDMTPALSNLLASEFDPDGDGIADFFFGRRFTSETGEAIRVNQRDFYRAMVGIEGDFGSTWRWSADYSYTNTDLDMRILNDVSVSRMLQGLLVDPLTGGCFDPSGGCVPVNPFGAGNISQAAADFMRLDGSSLDEQATEQVVNVTVRGSPLTLWAGDLDIAVGAEYRRDKIHSTPSDALLSGDSLFFGSDVASAGDISVKEAYAEARIPLVTDASWTQHLGLEAGVRVSDYNINDETLWTWKYGGEWQIVEGLRFRAMQQRAIRVPSVAELFQDSAPLGFFFELGPFFDQCSASRDPVGNELQDLCIAQGIPANQIGVFEADFFPTALDFSSNPNLEAEEADTLTAGIVWQPAAVPALSTSIDYFRIKIDNASALIFPEEALALCFITKDPNDQFCSTFTRGASGDIDTSLITFVNAAQTRSEGIDFALDYGWDMDGLALFDGGTSFDLSFLATYYLEAGARASPLAPFLDCPGNFGALCGDFVFLGALPKLRSNTRLTYTSGPFSASLRWTYIDEMTNSENEIREITGRQPAVLAVPSVSAVNYFDLTLEGDIGENWNLRFGVINLFDKDPPFLGSANEDANTDPRTYDTLGRRYFLRLTAFY